jgi:hypothetical protein
MAMTLYEMTTGVLPQWGDGQSDPAVRDALSAFFTRVLHSDYRQRFDNAEEMRRAWQRVFASVDQPSTETDHGPLVDLEHALSTAMEETPLSTLGPQS